jgi:hypothetical protein
MAEDHEFGWERIAVSWRWCRIWATASLVAVHAMSRAGTAQPGGAPLQRVQTIPLTGPSGRLGQMALDTVRHRLFVANTPNDSLDVLDLTQGKLIKQVPGQRGIHSIAYGADLNVIFVGNASGDLSMFDGRDYHLLKRMQFQGEGEKILYDPRTQRAYVSHAPPSLAAIDAKAHEVIKEIPLPGDPDSFQLERDRPRLYLNIPGSRQVVVINTETQTIENTYRLEHASANFPMALDEAHHRLLLGCRQPPLLDVIDTESAVGEEVMSASVPGDAGDIWYDAEQRHVYISCGEGYLAVVQQQDQDEYREIARLRTEPGARSSLYDPAAHRLYLLVPKHEGGLGPEVWVFQTHP